MQNKIRLNLTVSEDTKRYFEEYKEKHHLRSISEAVDGIARHSMNTDNVDLIADRLLSKMEEKYKNIFTRIRLASTTSDINSQVMLEILNSMLINMNVKKGYMTDVVEAQVVTESKQHVKNKIAKFKQIKDNKKTE